MLAGLRGRVAYTSCSACCSGVNRPKSIVISPYNALLAMHHMQATKYFLETSLRVETLLPSNVAADEISSDFDLLFISIHAIKDLMEKHPNQLRQWNIKSIFIDSLTSITTYLGNCSVTQTRGCLYVTWQDTTSKSFYYQQWLTHYSWTLLVILGNYKVIGELDQYPFPNIVINVKRYSDAEVLSVLVQRIKQLNISKKDRLFKIHIVVMTKDAAGAFCEALSAKSISCLMLTNDCLQSKKSRIRCLHGKKETSNAWCLLLLMELIMEW